MKISKVILAIAVASTFLTSCRDTETTEEHGHEHDVDGTHMDAEHMEQEEFTVDSTSLEMKKESDSHSHDDGSEHHDH